MRRLLLLAGSAAAAVAVAAAPAGAATNECKGLQVCVPVVGPWVVLPTKLSVPRPQQQFQLACPKGYIVGGFDAELSDRAIDVEFLGTMGAPVNPGISTAPEAIFVGTYVGGTARIPSFRPHIGCMPTRGGGSRTPTALVFPPGRAIVRHVKSVALHPGRQLVTEGCAPGSRLVDAWHAVAFQRPTPPDAALASVVSVAQSVAGLGTSARIRTAKVPAGTRALVEVAAVCAGSGP